MLSRCTDALLIARDNNIQGIGKPLSLREATMPAKAENGTADQTGGCGTN